MDDLDQIRVALQRQRRDLENEIEERRSVGDDIGDLLDRLDRLKDRLERAGRPDPRR